LFNRVCRPKEIPIAGEIPSAVFAKIYSDPKFTFDASKFRPGELDRKNKKNDKINYQKKIE